MILKDVAEKTNLDISTISRVVNSKYVETPYGTLSLRYFFSESIAKRDGENISVKEVKKIIKVFFISALSLSIYEACSFMLKICRCN